MWLLIDGDEASLAEILSFVFTLPSNQLIYTGKRGKKWMQREYSWELSCQKTKEAYKWVKYGNETRLYL